MGYRKVPITLQAPAGETKSNRLFSFMSLKYRGKPLVSPEVIISLIAATTTTTGVKVYAQLDIRPYPTKIAASDEQLAAVIIARHPFHGKWGYTIRPSVFES